MKFKGGSTKNLKEEFAERKKYKELATLQMSGYMLDTWYQYPNYGFLNEQFEPVITLAGNSYENLSTFGEYSPPAQRALPFVVKAYNKFRDSFLLRAESPNFSIPSYFDQLIPKKTHESFEVLYSEYINKTKTDMSAVFARADKERLLNYVLENIKVFPITQSGFLLSRHCPISTTGMAIEISELNPKIDSEKGELISSGTYECFLRDAAQAGFYVDKNNPWRLIANLESRPMQDLILEYKENAKPEYILSRFFRRKTQYEDMHSVYVFFNKSLTLEELFRYTIKIRMAETGIHASLEERITKEAQEIYTLYSQNYPQDPFKGSSSIIAKYCSEKLRDTYITRSRINSYNSTKLKELL